jgi:feruloyl esterase
MSARIVTSVLTPLAVVALAAAQISHALAATTILSEADCSAARLGINIPVKQIALPVAVVVLQMPEWRKGQNGAPDYCVINGSMQPVDQSATARPIRFSVALPATWTRRAAQLGGGGMNGVVPNLISAPTATPNAYMQLGFAVYGSDSGHQSGAAAEGTGDSWALNDEALRNLGYMQMKKTHDAAMVLIRRAYGVRPRYNYYIGTSQGGREALTVAQRFPADYNGVAANVPIVNFSSLMLAPEWNRIQEKLLANWITPAKTNVIRSEFMRQCDSLDGLVDGVMNNYIACRAIFDIKQGAPNRDPWAARRCPGNVDPDPVDASAAACLTSGQIESLQKEYSPYEFSTPLANGVKSFGMWVPNTDPAGSGLIVNMRYRGQEGAAESAPAHSHLGVLGVTGFLMQELKANPLDYVEGGLWNARREELSTILDSTNPDLSTFRRRGGKLIVAIGTDDTLASPGAQLAYYQSVIDTMGRKAVDSFARLYVLPQANHGLSARTAAQDGEGKPVAVHTIPTTFDRLKLLMNWVEQGIAPGMQETVTADTRSLPMCSYPAYPRYNGGSVDTASSYSCSR